MNRTKVPDYQEYLRSDAWKARRVRVFAAAGGICLGCGRRAQCVHHRTYARLGRELGADLVALCDDCHRDCHLNHAEHAEMGLWAATNMLIVQRRALFGLPPVRFPSERSASRAARKSRSRISQPQGPGIPVNSPIRVEIRSVSCPKCRAGAGEPCRSGRGNTRSANHQKRVLAYQSRPVR